MSNIADIKTEIKDLEALKAACKEQGWTFHENQKTYAWWGSHHPNDTMTLKARANPPEGLTADDLGKCDHAISIPDLPEWQGFKLQVGLRKTATGYRVVCDDMLTSDKFGVSAIGINAGKLLQTYAIHKATIEARKRGYMVQRVPGQNGKVHLQITGIK